MEKRKDVLRESELITLPSSSAATADVPSCKALNPQLLQLPSGTAHNFSKMKRWKLDQFRLPWINEG